MQMENVPREIKRLKRIPLSIAEVTELERKLVSEALDSGWVTTLGPDVSLFEEEIAKFADRKFGVALASGTAALHLSFKAVGIGVDDEVIVPTKTFAATVFPLLYLKAKPMFVDVDSKTMTLDSGMLADYLKASKLKKVLPKAIVAVDLYGNPCDYDSLLSLSIEYEIPIVCDSAEAIGAKFKETPVGSHGKCSIFSFNGNKIMTTSGGGMFLTDDELLAEKIRYWAAQSRQPEAWYEHKEVGFNYRLSNILASLGRAQLKRLPEFILKRRQIRSWYTEQLGLMEGVDVMQDPPWGTSNAWLTVALFDIERYPNAPVRIREALEQENIESRPLWKPMHQQPIFAGSESFLNGTSDKLFDRGLCLPSSASLTKEDVSRVCEVIVSELKGMRSEVKS